MKLTPTLYRRIARETKKIKQGQAVFVMEDGCTMIHDLNNFKGLVMRDGSEIDAVLMFESALTYKEVGRVFEAFYRLY